MDTPGFTTYKEIKEVIKGMGADEVSVVRRGYRLHVAFKRYGRGCSKIHNRVIDWLARRFMDMIIFVYDSPKPNRVCDMVLVREAGTEEFIRTKRYVRATILDF